MKEYNLFIIKNNYVKQYKNRPLFLYDMLDSLFYWGVAKRYQYGNAVAAVDWNSVSDKKKKSIEKATSKIARKIQHNFGQVKPGIKTRGFFFIMHLMQKNGFNPKDAEYWKEKGWTGKVRPWK